MPRKCDIPYHMKLVFQLLHSVFFAKKPNCEIEYGVIISPTQIVQNKVFVFVRNEFLVENRFSRYMLGYFLSQNR